MNKWLLCFMEWMWEQSLTQFSDKRAEIMGGYITTTDGEISSEKEGSCHQRGNDRWNHEIACVPQLESEEKERAGN